MFATIDIGTNSVLLLIGDILHDGRIRVIADECKITRLGEGLITNQNLSEQAIERTVKALHEYKELCDNFNVPSVACIATEVLRKASNASQFISHVKKDVGFNIEVISPDREAWLTFLACSKDFGEDILVCDIGGGSTEIVWGKASGNIPKRKNESGVYQYISIPIGSVLITEQCIKNDPVIPEDVRLARDTIDHNLMQALLPLYQRHPQRLVATAGTATTLASIHKHMQVYDREKVQGLVLEMLDLHLVIDELKAKTIAERRKILGLQAGREDVILAGAIILDRIMRKFGYDEVTISDRGLRWGLFYERFT